MMEGNEVSSTIALASALVILAKSNVQNPMKRVLNAPNANEQKEAGCRPNQKE